MFRFFSNLTHKFLIAIALIRFLSKIIVKIDIIVVLVAHASQAEGDGFDSRGRHPKLYLVDYSFVPKTHHRNAPR